MSAQGQRSRAFHGMSTHVSVIMAPENVDKFLAAFKPCFDLVTAKAECTYFKVFHDPNTPGHFTWVEHRSRDKNWLMKVSTSRLMHKDPNRNISKERQQQ